MMPGTLASHGRRTRSRRCSIVRRIGGTLIVPARRLSVALAVMAGLVVAGAAGPPPARAVVHGSVADVGATPWAGQLLAGDAFVCGASLVGPRIVLTAAHCAQDPAQASTGEPPRLEVAFGRARSDGHDGEEIDVVDVVVHPGFRATARSARDDVALLELAQAPLGVTPVRLAQPGDATYIRPGTRLTVLGWGQTDPRASFEDLTPPASLHAAHVPLRSIRSCRRFWGRSYDARSTLCAGAVVRPHPDACTGDSGGPLVAFLPYSPPSLVGVVSYGTRSCGAGPTAYARTWFGPLQRWLRAQMSASTLAGG
jgi:secreted trypsin-like serine protease